MSKKLPYEDAFERQMNHLPSPDENESWRKMKKLLDDRERRVPFVFFKNYKVWTSLILLLLIGTWLIIRSLNIPEEKPVAALENSSTLQKKALTQPSSKTVNKPPAPKRIVAEVSSEPVNNQDSHRVNSTSAGSIDSRVAYQKPGMSIGAGNKPSLVETSIKEHRSKQNRLPADKQTAATKTGDTVLKGNNFSTKDNSNRGKALEELKKNETPPGEVSITQTGVGDQLIAQPKDSLSHKDNAATKDIAVSKKTVQNKLKHYLVTAGIGVQQQIPVGGQQFVHYGHNGNNSALSDYIPSVYFHFERKQKWFLQAGFSHGSPQLVKEFSYSQHTSAHYQVQLP